MNEMGRIDVDIVIRGSLVNSFSGSCRDYVIDSLRGVVVAAMDMSVRGSVQYSVDPNFYMVMGVFS